MARPAEWGPGKWGPGAGCHGPGCRDGWPRRPGLDPGELCKQSLMASLGGGQAAPTDGSCSIGMVQTEAASAGQAPGPGVHRSPVPGSLHYQHPPPRAYPPQLLSTVLAGFCKALGHAPGSHLRLPELTGAPGQSVPDYTDDSWCSIWCNFIKVSQVGESQGKEASCHSAKPLAALYGKIQEQGLAKGPAVGSGVDEAAVSRRGIAPSLRDTGTGCRGRESGPDTWDRAAVSNDAQTTPKAKCPRVPTQNTQVEPLWWFS